MSHINITGQSQTGKSTVAIDRAISDIHAGHAVVYLDTTGQDIDIILNHVPKKRRQDVTVFDLNRYTIPWNFFDTTNIPLSVDELTQTLKQAWGIESENTPIINLIISNALYAVMESGGGLFDFYLMLESLAYREKSMHAFSNPVVKRYWTKFHDKKLLDQEDLLMSVFNKVQPLVADPRIRAMAGRQSRLHIPSLVHNKILLIRLCQGEIGSGKAKLLGSIILAQLYKSSLRRKTDVPLSIYINNVQEFVHTPVIHLLTNSASHNVEVVTIEQYLGQLHPDLRAAIKANCIQYVFRLSYEDSKAFPEVPPQAIQPYALEPFSAWLFGFTDRPQMVNLPPPTRKPYVASAREIDAIMRENYVASAIGETDRLLSQFP